MRPTNIPADATAPPDTLRTVGFIGLGVMGGAMCRNTVRRGVFDDVLLYDAQPSAMDAVLAVGGTAVSGPAAVAAGSDAVVLSLPDGAASESVLRALLPHLRPGQLVLDTSTIPVRIARELSAACAARQIDYLDAPVARTREAAEAGTLSVMVGGLRAAADRAGPLLRCIASDVSYCGGPGSGQVVKILNNMVLFQTVNALAEALTIAERAGVDGALLYETFSKGSADSFALRNHGMKAMLPRRFPLRAFSTRYARKDLDCARELARDVGVTAPGADLLDTLFERSLAAGMGEAYFPTLLRLHDDGAGAPTREA